MIKRYCDGCGKEMSADALTQPKFKHVLWPGTGREQHKVEIQVWITRSVDGTANAGEVCIECIQETVAEGVVVKA